MASPAVPGSPPDVIVRGDWRLPALHAALVAMSILLCVEDVRERDFVLSALQALLAVALAVHCVAGAGARLALRGERLELSRLLLPSRVVSTREIAAIDAGRHGLRFDVRGGSDLRLRARRGDALALLEALRGRVDAGVERGLDSARADVLGPP